MARKGGLCLRDGSNAIGVPCALNPAYGFLWWLNGDGAHVPNAPRTSYFALGVGRNVIWIDPELDLVVVVRWIDRDRFADFAGHLTAALA